MDDIFQHWENSEEFGPEFVDEDDLERELDADWDREEDDLDEWHDPDDEDPDWEGNLWGDD